MVRVPSVVLLTTCLSCGAIAAGQGQPLPPTTIVRKAIQAEIDAQTAATRAKDIDAYMATIPAGFALKTDGGKQVTREQLRAGIQRDWSIIPHTISLDAKVESLQLTSPTEAVVYTSQRWHRMMLEKDGVTQDDVVTTERHRENWHKSGDGWKAYRIEELGGKIWVNGKPYQP